MILSPMGLLMSVLLRHKTTFTLKDILFNLAFPNSNCTSSSMTQLTILLNGTGNYFTNDNVESAEHTDLLGLHMFMNYSILS